MKLSIAVALFLLCIAAGSVFAFAAWNTMYPEKGRRPAKIAVNAFTGFVFLCFVVFGLAAGFGVYD